LISYNANYSTAGAQEPFTRFNPDGSLNGFTGCNNFNGRWTSAPSVPTNQLTVSALSSTKTACPTAALSSQEQTMLAVLGTAQNYQVAGNSLQIVGSQGNLTYSLSPLNRPEEVAEPNAVIVAPNQAPVNQVITFDGTQSTSGVPLTSWKWDFGDGGRGTGPVVQHVYKNPGDYKVQMSVYDQLGRVSSAAKSIQILAQAVPTVTPTAPLPPTKTPTVPVEPSLVPTEFPLPTSTPPAIPTEAPLPTEAPTLAPTEAPPPTVTPTMAPPPTEAPPAVPPTAAVQGPQTGYVGEPVDFSAAGSQPGSSPIQSYTWDFGDGVTAQSADGSQATHLYNNGGTYQVTVVVTDANGLSSSATTEITISEHLDTTLWSLSASSSVTPAPGTEITLSFQSGQLAGFAGCNNYTGSYTATDNGDGTYSVSGSNLSTSKSICPDEVMIAENAYLQALQQVTTAQVQGDTLVLNYPAGVLNFK